MVATEEPDIAAKKVQATIETKEIPPEIHPTKESAKDTSRLDSPPFDIMSPARKKAGSANMEKLSQPVKIFCVIIARDKVGSKKIAAIQAPPNAQVIGRPISIRTIKTTIKAIADADITCLPLS